MAFDVQNTMLETRSRMQDPDPNPQLPDSDLTSAIRAALRRFSRDSTRYQTTEFAGTGVSYYPLLTTLPSWVDGYSAIRQIEFPAFHPNSSGQQSWTLQPDLDWQIVEAVLASVNTQYLWFPNDTPQSTDLVRVLYTIPHTLNGLDGSTPATTIPVQLEMAFYDLCAFYGLQRIANQTAQRGRSNLSSDQLNYEAITGEILKNAADYLTSYQIAIGESMTGAPFVDPTEGAGFVNWSTRNVRGTDWLFHTMRTR